MMSALKHALDKSEKKVPILDKIKWSIRRAQKMVRMTSTVNHALNGNDTQTNLI